MDKALEIFHIEASELLEEMESALIRLESSPSDLESLNSVFRAAHTIKGSAGVVGLVHIEDFTHRVESLLDSIRSGKREVTGELIELLLECRDHIADLVAGIADSTHAPGDMAEREKRLSALLSGTAKAGAEATPSPEPGSKETAPRTSTTASSGVPRLDPESQPVHIDDDQARKKSSTIRVDIDKLDSLVNAVGELVVSGASIKQEADRLRKKRLSGLADNLMRLIEDIRESTMSVRMTPVWETFNRFRRMVRDMCHETGKEVEISISGGETELDRNVIEQIKDPLVHLVRNAVDHGIELPEERLQKGKPRVGRLLLNAYQETGDIIIEVSDDGRGMDRDAIIANAVERGTIQNGEALTDEQITSLIFTPGISTAGKVTNISGRGVGMDVVRQNIEDLRGSVSIRTSQTDGTSVKVRLPLTLAIIEGFLVSIGRTYFIVPMDMVVECLELTEADRRAAHGRDHIELRGHVLPYIRLRSVFDITDDMPDHEHILVVRHAGKSVGLLVDMLVGETSTVIKTLGRYYRDVEGISGATIMGDGTVALIVDVPRLVRSAMGSAH